MPIIYQDLYMKEDMKENNVELKFRVVGQNNAILL